MHGHGNTKGEVVSSVDIWGETEDALVRELASVVLKVTGIVDHEEGVVQVDLGHTISHGECVIHGVARKLVLV